MENKEGNKRQDRRKNEMISGRNGERERRVKKCVYCLVTNVAHIWHVIRITNTLYILCTMNFCMQLFILNAVCQKREVDQFPSIRL